MHGVGHEWVGREARACGPGGYSPRGGRVAAQATVRASRRARHRGESAAVLRPYVARESAEKLTRFDQLAAGETIPAPRFKGMGIGDGAAGMDLLVRPIKSFAQARSRSITEQLEGKSPGEVIQVSPIGLGMFYGQSFLNALDTNHDGQVSREEFTGTFARWFDTWDDQKTGVVSVPQLQAGLERALKPATTGDKP